MNSELGSGLPSDRHPQDFSHLLDPKNQDQDGTPLPFISRQRLQRSLEDLKDELRTWLDALYNNFVQLLQRKAAQTSLSDLAEKLQFTDKDLTAAFARRRLQGYCASC